MLALGARCRRFESFRPDQKFQPAAFAAVLIFCLERADSNDKQSFAGVRIFHSVALRSACILVVVQTSHCSFSHTRIPSAYACGYPRSCSNFALLVFTYSDSPRPEIRKVVVILSAQISDITYTGKFRTVKDA